MAALATFQDFARASGFPLLEDYALLVSGQNELPSQIIRIDALILLENGELVTNQFLFPIGFDRTFESITFDLTRGVLLSVAATSTLVGTLRGQTYITVQLVKTGGTTPTTIATLLSNYISGLRPLSWPGDTITPADTGLGLSNTFTLSAPAAGSDWAYTVPSLTRFLISSISFTLVTEATASSRFIEVQFNFGVNLMFSVMFTLAQAASLTVDYSLAGGAPTVAMSTRLSLNALPNDFILQPATVISSVTESIQAADQFSSVRISGRQWLSE